MKIQKHKQEGNTYKHSQDVLFKSCNQLPVQQRTKHHNDINHTFIKAGTSPFNGRGKEFEANPVDRNAKPYIKLIINDITQICAYTFTL